MRSAIVCQPRKKAREGHAPRSRRPVSLLVAGLAAGLLTGCAVNRTVVNLIGDALADGRGVYASDDDPDLIREAIPFGLKTYESLLAVSPGHRGLLLAAASGFAAYAYLLQTEADRLDPTDLPRARELRSRACKLYLRGRDHALRGLEAIHPGLGVTLSRDRVSALAITTKEDVPFLYWAGTTWAGALTAAKDDLGLLAELPMAGALVARVLELDETYERGAAHEFFISYEGSRPEAMGGSVRRAREHYRQALEISGGLRASAHLALAEAVTIRQQNLAEFQALIVAALAVDPDKASELRLVNTITQRRARWLESRIPELFSAADDLEVSQ